MHQKEKWKLFIVTHKKFGLNLVSLNKTNTDLKLNNIANRINPQIIPFFEVTKNTYSKNANHIKI
jgi:hypothetical protein